MLTGKWCLGLESITNIKYRSGGRGERLNPAVIVTRLVVAAVVVVVAVVEEEVVAGEEGGVWW